MLLGWAKLRFVLEGVQHIVVFGLLFHLYTAFLILQNMRFAHGCMLLLYIFIITAYGANASFGAVRFDVFAQFLLMFTKI